MMHPRQQYRVVGHYVTAKIMSVDGPMVTGFNKGMILPYGVDPASIKHLLGVKLIEPFGDMPEPTVDVDPVVDTLVPEPEPEAEEPPARSNTPTPPTETIPIVDDEAETRRAEARAKLPTDGTLPTRRHGQQVWVEAAVLRGYDRAAVEADTKDELVDLLAGAV
jgi:hypothetical protein